MRLLYHFFVFKTNISCLFHIEIFFPRGQTDALYSFVSAFNTQNFQGMACESFAILLAKQQFSRKTVSTYHGDQPKNLMNNACFL